MESSAADLTSRFLRHERAILTAAIALLAALGWWFLAAGGGMDGMAGMAGMRPGFAELLVMWWVMMAAMMLPSAIPAVLLYAKARSARSDAKVAASWLFLLGYVFAWLGFSVAAALATSLLGNHHMAVGNRYAEAALLIAAGAYQLSPLKNACLRQCRSPAQLISRHWRAGNWGAVRLGLLHGLYCIGCCWMLMALLFVGGVMNLALVALLTALVAAEKLLPNGRAVARISGVTLLAAGIALSFL